MSATSLVPAFSGPGFSWTEPAERPCCSARGFVKVACFRAASTERWTSVSIHSPKPEHIETLIRAIVPDIDAQIASAEVLADDEWNSVSDRHDLPPLEYPQLVGRPSFRRAEIGFQHRAKMNVANERLFVEHGELPEGAPLLPRRMHSIAFFTGISATTSSGYGWRRLDSSDRRPPHQLFAALLDRAAKTLCRDAIVEIASARTTSNAATARYAYWGPGLELLRIA